MLAIGQPCWLVPILGRGPKNRMQMVMAEMREDFPALRLLRAAVFAAGLVAIPLAATAPTDAAAHVGSDELPELADRLLPAVVNISTSQAVPAGADGGLLDQFQEYFERRQGDGPQIPRANALGSGFIIDPRGFIVTNNHVIENADEISIRLHDEREYQAELVGTDDKTDLALLKIDPGTVSLPYVTWGRSEDTRVGEWVMAIGNPFGLGGSVTVGIVSARQRDINAGPYDSFLQTDASINRGNSGGPMFNMEGEVIGVNTAIFSPTGGSVGIGFAVPSSLARGVIAQLMEYGRTRRGWLGVRIQKVTDEIAESLGLGPARGALIASITPGGPAEQAQMKAGDVVLSFNGRDVGEMRRLPRIVAETEVESTVPVEVWRDGEQILLSVVVGELEMAEKQNLVQTARRTPGGQSEQTYDDMGLKLANLTDELRQRFGLESAQEGVVVTEVAPTGDAETKGIQVGDVIVEVSQDSVASIDDVDRLIEKAEKDGRRSVLLLVDRKGEKTFVALRIGAG